MRLLVDTSVWGDFFNGHPSPQAIALEAYVEAEAELATCGLVLSEVFQGFRDPGALRELRPYFEDMLYLTPVEPDTYFKAASLFRELRRRRRTVRSTIDCILAQLAADNGCLVLAKDRDFEAIIESKVLDVSAAPLDPTRLDS